MTRIEVEIERETGRGWSYEVSIRRDRAGDPDTGTSTATAIGTTRHTITLSWVDHEHWCGGVKAPSRVIEALVATLLAREGDSTATGAAFELPAIFDAATARRWFSSLDDELMQRL